ncbi:MAG: cytochrome b/b6 domain-containing protein [Deltaproteobacteria bacterium]|nr:cytochrome b/b6 domain-containing protein [Deltaproteobacteria bacterium]
MKFIFSILTLTTMILPPAVHAEMAAASDKVDAIAVSDTDSTTESDIASYDTESADANSNSEVSVPTQHETSKALSQETLLSSSVSPMHPAVEPLNVKRQNAFYTNTEIDPVATCGNCHDTGFIQNHNTHHFSEAPDYASNDLNITCFDCHVPDMTEWKKENIDIYGRLAASKSRVRRATSKVCSQCHGILESNVLSIPDDYETRLRDENGYLTYDLTRTTGALVSDMPYSKSQLNLKNKASMQYPADVHAARLVGCTDCHHTANNPTRSGVRKSQLSHLKEDPRRVSFSEYLQQPDHTLATPKCTECHNALATHDFLPYKSRHLSVLDCQSCHVPKLYGPVLSTIDETVVNHRGNPVLLYAEAIDSKESLNAQLRAGISPSLLPYQDKTGKHKIGAFNFVVNWYWIDDNTGKRVSADVLKKAYLKNASGGYTHEATALFDQNKNGKVEKSELIIKSTTQNKAVTQWLKNVGVKQPRMVGEISAYPIAHGITNKDGVLASCDACHDADGRFAGNIKVSDRLPAGGTLMLGKNMDRLTHGQLLSSESLTWQRQGVEDTWYVFGFSRADWSDTGGFILFVLSFLGILAHGGYRFVTRKQRTHHAANLKKVYMYSLYERIWHWLMAASVIVLLITGLTIHFPLEMAFISFPVAVTLHNITAVVLVVNAALSLFFHVASAAIMQFIPARDGLIQSLIKQVEYYTRGIFLGHRHPTEKTPDKKLNPLQQLTYLGLLNVLFPLQVITGIAIWLNAGWPDLLNPIGGLTIIGPLHNLGSWMFLTFLAVHLYLTTTGHTLVSNIAAMVSGYDEIDESAIKGGSHD